MTKLENTRSSSKIEKDTQHPSQEMRRSLSSHSSSHSQDFTRPQDSPALPVNLHPERRRKSTSPTASISDTQTKKSEEVNTSQENQATRYEEVSPHSIHTVMRTDDSSTQQANPPLGGHKGKWREGEILQTLIHNSSTDAQRELHDKQEKTSYIKGSISHYNKMAIETLKKYRQTIEKDGPLRYARVEASSQMMELRDGLHTEYYGEDTRTIDGLTGRNLSRKSEFELWAEDLTTIIDANTYLLDRAHETITTLRTEADKFLPLTDQLDILMKNPENETAQQKQIRTDKRNLTMIDLYRAMRRDIPEDLSQFARAYHRLRSEEHRNVDQSAVPMISVLQGEFELSKKKIEEKLQPYRRHIENSINEMKRNPESYSDILESIQNPIEDLVSDKQEIEARIRRLDTLRETLRDVGEILFVGMGRDAHFITNTLDSYRRTIQANKDQMVYIGMDRARYEKKYRDFLEGIGKWGNFGPGAPGTAGINQVNATRYTYPLSDSTNFTKYEMATTARSMQTHDIQWSLDRFNEIEQKYSEKSSEDKRRQDDEITSMTDNAESSPKKMHDTETTSEERTLPHSYITSETQNLAQGVIKKLEGAIEDAKKPFLTEIFYGAIEVAKKPFLTEIEILHNHIANQDKTGKFFLVRKRLERKYKRRIRRIQKLVPNAGVEATELIQELAAKEPENNANLKMMFKGMPRDAQIKIVKHFEANLLKEAYEMYKAENDGKNETGAYNRDNYAISHKKLMQAQIDVFRLLKGITELNKDTIDTFKLSNFPTLQSLQGLQTHLNSTHTLVLTIGEKMNQLQKNMQVFLASQEQDALLEMSQDYIDSLRTPTNHIASITWNTMSNANKGIPGVP